MSGQIPLTPEGSLVEGSITDMTRQCCQNMKAVVEEAGSTMEKIVKVNIFLSDMDHFAVRYCCSSFVLAKRFADGV